MHQTTLTFPEIRLQQRDGHKLRGYFAQQFGEDSDLFHNHEKDGKAIYRYPLIQFKVVGGSPVLVGIGAGAHMLVQRFLDIKELNIDGQIYSLHHKNLNSGELKLGVTDDLFEYRFATPWMALNQDNHKAWLTMNEEERKTRLKKILAGNILNFYTAAEYHAKERILTHLNVQAKTTSFKNQRMTAFKGTFTTNALLPDYVGLGKSVARGYGTIIRTRESGESA